MAQKNPAMRTKATPMGSRFPVPKRLSQPKRLMPAMAMRTHRRSRVLFESTAERVSGPMNSMVTAVPSGIRESAA